MSVLVINFFGLVFIYIIVLFHFIQDFVILPYQFVCWVVPCWPHCAYLKFFFLSLLLILNTNFNALFCMACSFLLFCKLTFLRVMLGYSSNGITNTFINVNLILQGASLNLHNLCRLTFALAMLLFISILLFL